MTDWPLVVELGLAKTGTSSLHHFLSCNKWRVRHHICPRASDSPHYCASCLGSVVMKAELISNIMRAFEAGRYSESRLRALLSDHQHFFAAINFTTAPLDQVGDLGPELMHDCGGNAFAQVDDITMGACSAPQLTHLTTLVRVLPRACFVLTHRPVAHWLRSAANSEVIAPPAARSHHAVAVGDLLGAIVANCPIWPRNTSGVIAWYEDHYARARSVLRSSGRCHVEIEIEEAGAGERLVQIFPGASARCWPGSQSPATNPTAPTKRANATFSHESSVSVR